MQLVTYKGSPNTSVLRKLRMPTPASVVAAVLLLCLCWPAILAVDFFTFDPKQLKACYKQPANGCGTLSFQEYMSGQPSRLHLYSILERAPPRLRPANESVLTIVTTLNAARLESLEAQCHSWPGPLVAALYAPVLRAPNSSGNGNPALNEVEGAEMKELEGQGRATLDLAQSGEGSCQLRILLLYEFVDSVFLGALIPINALRNAALLGATTPLVAMIDVDLLISANLGQQLVTGNAQLKDIRTDSLIKKCQKERVALILPAFQTPKNRSINGYPEGEELQRSIELVQQLVQGNKSGVHQAVRTGQVIKFASQQFAIGHRRTDYSKWFETTVWYPVDFIPQFEPWYIVDRLQTPFYDVNFRGYGRNKQQQAAHASSVGMSFWVHPDSFLIHMPHDKSEAQKDHDATWINVKARQAIKGTGTRMAGQRAGAGRRSARQLRQAAAQESEGAEGMSQGLQHVRRVDKLFRQFVKQMPSQEFQTLLDPASFACLRSLPWWQGNAVAGWATQEKNQ